LSQSPFCSIITPYHFDSSDRTAYSRLIRSLNASIREVRGVGQVILVASGTAGKVADPISLVRDPQLAYGPEDIIACETILENSSNVRALNLGIRRALSRFTGADNEWIISVQSSVVLTEGWLQAALAVVDDDSIGAVYGRLVDEGDLTLTWADGHVLSGGRTLRKRLMPQSASTADNVFPCLSAAMFRTRLIQAIVGKYGNSVCENLAHYGDCTDIALRAREVDAECVFRYCPDALGTKRRPNSDADKRTGVAQLMAAGMYYSNANRPVEAEERVRKQFGDAALPGIRRDAASRLADPYSTTGEPAPIAQRNFDLKWGE
jgi:hypothetical protein